MVGSRVLLGWLRGTALTMLLATSFAVAPACDDEKKKSSRRDADDDDDEPKRSKRPKSAEVATTDGAPTDGPSGAKLAPQPAPAFTLTGQTFKIAEPILVTYNRPLIPPEGQQWWITLIEASKGEREWGAWHYVANGAIDDKLIAAAPGEYEVRLYDLHPASPYKVLARQKVTVVECKAASDCAGASATCDAGRCTGGAIPLQPPPPPPPEPAPPPAPPPQTDYLADGWPAAIPPTGSKAPSLEEWAAVPREVSVRHSTELKCETKMLREWFRASCRKNASGVPVGVSVTPAFGQQAFKFLAEGSVASVVAQMIPGKDFHATFTWRDRGDVTLTMSVVWENGRPRGFFNMLDD